MENPDEMADNVDDHSDSDMECNIETVENDPEEDDVVDAFWDGYSANPVPCGIIQAALVEKESVYSATHK